MKTTDEINTIATNMITFAINNIRTSSISSPQKSDPYRVELQDGLTILCYISVNGMWHLSIYRIGNYPTKTKLSRICQAFLVPKDALSIRKKIGGHWYIHKYSWPVNKNLFIITGVD